MDDLQGWPTRKVAIPRSRIARIADEGVAHLVALYHRDETLTTLCGYRKQGIPHKASDRLCEIVGNGFTRLCDACGFRMPERPSGVKRKPIVEGHPSRWAATLSIRRYESRSLKLPRLTRDVELLACEAACEDYYEREVDEVEWQAVSASWRPP